MAEDYYSYPDFAPDYFDFGSWANQYYPQTYDPWADWQSYDTGNYGDYGQQYPDFGSSDFGGGYGDLGMYDPAALQASDFSLPQYGGGFGDLGLSDYGAGGGGWSDYFGTGAGGGQYQGSTMPGQDYWDALLSGPYGAGGGGGGAPSISDLQRQLLQSQIGLANRQGQPGGLFGTGVQGSDILGAGGLLANLFKSGPPGPSALDKEMQRAQIAKIQADIENAKEALAIQREKLGQGGGGGGGPAGPDPGLIAAQINSLNAQAEAARRRAAVEERRPGGAANVAQFLQAAGLGGQKASFDTLYNQIVKESSGIPKPDEATVQQRATELVAQQSAEIESRYRAQEDQILERANRLGTNPAGELAKLQELKQQELGGLRVSARTQALAEMQQQQAMLLGQLTPTMSLLQLLNPTQYAGQAANVFSQVLPEGLTGALGA